MASGYANTWLQGPGLCCLGQTSWAVKSSQQLAQSAGFFSHLGSTESFFIRCSLTQIVQATLLRSTETVSQIEPALTFSPRCDLGKAPFLPEPQLGKELHQSVSELPPSSDSLGFQSPFPSQASNLVVKDSESGPLFRIHRWGGSSALR